MPWSLIIIAKRVFLGKRTCFPNKKLHWHDIFKIHSLFEIRKKAVGDFGKTKRLTNKIVKTLPVLVIRFCTEHEKTS